MNKQQSFDYVKHFEDKNIEWITSARRSAVEISRRHHGFVNTDLLREYVSPPPNASPSIFGSVFHTPYFEGTGNYISSSRKISHHRPIQWFRVLENKVPAEWRAIYKQSETGNLMLF